MTNTQKVIKYCALAFAFFLIVNIMSGIIFALSSLTIMFDYSKTNGPYESFESNSNTSILNIELRATSLIIKKGDLLKTETNNKYIDVRQNNNKLYITEEKHSSVNYKDNDLVIYIPDDMIFDEVFITTGAGSINSEVINTDKIELNLGAGNVSIQELNVNKKADVEGGVGKLNIADGRINNLDLSLGVGEATIKSDITGDSDIEMGVGSLNLNLLNKKDNYKIKADKGLGSININGINVEDEMVYGTGSNLIDIDGGIGSINVRFEK